MVIQKILCQDITGNCIEAIDKKSVENFVKQLKEEIKIKCGPSHLLEIINELTCDALDMEGEKDGN